jgi:hypothetical protein
MVEFLLHLPLWALALVLNAWLMGFAVVSLWAARRWMPRLRQQRRLALLRRRRHAVRHGALRAGGRAHGGKRVDAFTGWLRRSRR